MPAGQSKLREPLSRERIELAAFEVIEAEGFAEFSTRKLARRLGCEAMSIYHHFPSKAHLLDALIDRIMAAMPSPPDHLATRQKLRFVAEAFRDAGLRQPAFFQYLALHRMNTRVALCWLDRTISLFREAGLSDEVSARLFRATGFYLMGAILDETNGYARGPSALEPVSGEEIMRDFPSVAAAAPWFQTPEHKANFDYGLAFFLDAFDGEIARSRKDQPSL